MKKLGPILLGIIIGVLVSYFYFDPGESEEIPPQKMAESKAPRGLISPEEAIALDKAFNIRHQLLSDSLVKRPDNRSSWYSLDDLRAYLSYAENQSKGLGYTMDGIRIYLGAYPGEGDQAGYTTMFIVPTGNKSTSEGTMLNINFQGGSGDIPGGDGLNKGDNGEPPQGNYPNT